MSEQRERKPLEPVLREAEITIYMRKWDHGQQWGRRQKKKLDTRGDRASPPFHPPLEN